MIQKLPFTFQISKELKSYYSGQWSHYARFHNYTPGFLRQIIVSLLLPVNPMKAPWSASQKSWCSHIHHAAALSVRAAKSRLVLLALQLLRYGTNHPERLMLTGTYTLWLSFTISLKRHIKGWYFWNDSYHNYVLTDLIIFLN